MIICHVFPPITRYLPRRGGLGVDAGWGRLRRPDPGIRTVSHPRKKLASFFVEVYTLPQTRDIIVYIIILHVKKDLERTPLRPNTTITDDLYASQAITMQQKVPISSPSVLTSLSLSF